MLYIDKQCHGNLYRDSIIMIRADFQQGKESVSLFKMNTVTENDWRIYAAAMVLLWHF